eukprot:460156-Rhodomonas_salina.1
MFLVLLFPGTFRSNIQEYEEKIYWKQWYADPGTRVPTGTPADCIAGNPIPRIAAITKNCTCCGGTWELSSAMAWDDDEEDDWGECALFAVFARSNNPCIR